MITAKIENWSYHKDINVIWGEIHGDQKKRWPDGTLIHTSNIPGGRDRSFSEGDVVETLNSKYRLGREYRPPKFIPSKFDEIPGAKGDLV